MAQWLPLPPEPTYYQPDQLAFLDARRQRQCPVCQAQWSVIGEDNTLQLTCLTCGVKGERLFDRFTLIAGRRFGKTRFGSISALEEASIPGSVGWACAPTNDKLHRYVIPAFRKLIPEDWVADWNVEHHDLLLKNGSLVHFQTLQEPDQGRGQGLDWLWIDEVCELTKKHWEVIRPSLGDKLGIAFFTTSPRSYDWVYDELYKPAEAGVPGYWALMAKTADNPKFQTDAGKEFLERERASMSPEMFAQEYEASFVTFTGAIYPHFDSQILRDDAAIKRLIPEWPDIDPWRPVTVGLDTGADHPFGGVKLVTTEQGMVVVGEYLERNRSFIEHASSLHWLSRTGSAAIPPSIRWACNKNEKQGMIELAQHGIQCRAAENDQVAGIERVKTWLHTKQLWFVEKACPKTIRQMKSYRWDENKSPRDEQKRKERVYKKDDELPDCLRYALMSWPKPSASKPVAGPAVRDLSHLSPEIRSTVEWIRRVDAKRESPEPADVTGDFWG
jgi:hypothetical protein